MLYSFNIMQKTTYIKTLTCALSIFLLAGCGTLERLAEHESAAKLTIQYSTLKYVDEDSEKATRIIEIVSEVRNHLNRSEVSEIGSVYNVVLAQIDFGRLDQADQFLVRGLLEVIQEEISKRIDSEFLTEGDKVMIGNVLNWVEAAARVSL